MDKAVLTGIVDAAATTLVLLVGRFFAPGDVELVKALVVAWQPIAVSLVAYFAYQTHLAVEMARIESEERQTREYNEQLFTSKKSK